MLKKQNIFAILIFLFLCPFLMKAQEEKPILLPIPADWKYEKIDFPLDFAPEAASKGFEELRFAPGMFDRNASDYFTYIFALSFSDKSKLKKKELQVFLEKYYKGLYSAVLGPKEVKLNLSKIKVKVKRVWNRKKKKRHYTAKVLFFDAFTDGNEVLLNMEFQFRKGKTNEGLLVFALVSPQPKSSEVWKELYSTLKKL